VFEQGRLVGVSGVHLFSEEYQVAAIGNIAVEAEFRGRGLGERLVSRLCRELIRRVEFIGLNVKVDNQIALALYDRLGFKATNHYGEFFARV
ncbi:GNAT family N-acetyltransferase, partial [bacterium]|nr:GNAT family N-acetyltransferase [bacterium]